MLRNLWLQSRPANALPPMVALMAGAAAASLGRPFDASIYAAFTAIGLLMLSGGLQNDLADLPIDTAGKRDSPLVRKRLTISGVRTAQYVLLIAGLAAAAYGGRQSLVWALLFCAAIFAYNTRPVQASRRPLLSVILLGLILGLIPVIWGYVLVGEKLGSSFLLLAAGFGLHRSSVSVLKDYKDYAQDLQYAKQTFLIRYGAVMARRCSLVVSAAGYICLAGALIMYAQLSWQIGLVAVLVLGLAGYAFLLRKQLGTQQNSFAANNLRFYRLFNTALYIELGIVACLYIS